MQDSTERLASLNKKILVSTKKRRKHVRALSHLERHLDKLREEMLQLLMQEKRGT